MNAVEKTLLEQMQNEKFQNVVRDNFAFVDSFINSEKESGD